MSKIGIIGGSGLYDIQGLTGKRWVTVRTPFGKPSDQFLTGVVSGREVVFLPRHGRGHRVLPSELNHRANIWGMKKLGVSRLISVSAVGSLKEAYAPTHIVMVDQFLDRTKRSADFTFFGGGIVAHIGFAEPICPQLRRTLLETGRKVGARTHDGGTYVNMEGPAFSTKAESMFHRNMGWDVIGMTNLGEARCAREAEICYSTMAMVTDYDCWHETEASVTVEMVIGHLMKNAETAREIIRRALVQIDPTADCTCQNALQNAIMTAPEKIPEAARKKLGLLVGKYLKKKG